MKFCHTQNLGLYKMKCLNFRFNEKEKCNPINMLGCSVLTTRRDSTDGKAAAWYPSDPGFDASRFLHAAACLGQ